MRGGGGGEVRPTIRQEGNVVSAAGQEHASPAGGDRQQGQKWGVEKKIGGEGVAAARRAAGTAASDTTEGRPCHAAGRRPGPNNPHTRRRPCRPPSYACGGQQVGAAVCALPRRRHLRSRGLGLGGGGLGITLVSGGGGLVHLLLGGREAPVQILRRSKGGGGRTVSTLHQGRQCVGFQAHAPAGQPQAMHTAVRMRPAAH